MVKVTDQTSWLWRLSRMIRRAVINSRGFWDWIAGWCLGTLRPPAAEPHGPGVCVEDILAFIRPACLSVGSRPTELIARRNQMQRRKLSGDPNLRWVSYVCCKTRKNILHLEIWAIQVEYEQHALSYIARNWMGKFILWKVVPSFAGISWEIKFWFQEWKKIT